MADDADAMSDAELNRQECLALLASTTFGQLAFTRNALPAVIPALYAVYPDQVLIHAVVGQDGTPWKGTEIVALHTSAFDDHHRYGWSVTVTGVGHQAIELQAADTVPSAPWIAPNKGDLIALATGLISGERLGPTNDPRRT